MCGLDVMKIIVIRRHPPDFEDLEQTYDSRNLHGETTILIKIFTTSKVNRSLSPQSDRFSNVIFIL